MGLVFGGLEFTVIPNLANLVARAYNNNNTLVRRFGGERVENIGISL